VRSLAIDEVVITIAQASRAAIRRIVQTCESIPVKVWIMPGIWEILQGDVEVSSIRDVQIEDLLGRDPVKLDEEELRRFLVGSVVMVTGAGGSIGSELARQAARLGPRQLLLVERAEFALLDVDREARMRRVFEDHRPQIILHAAAHKHVPLMEANASEAIHNNVLGTARLGTLAGEYGVDVFVMISTDKAVRPTSIMDLAHEMITLSGLKPNEDIDVVFTGVRPGEKLYEEMGTEEENVPPTGKAKILIGKIPPSPPDVVEQALGKLRRLAEDGHEEPSRAIAVPAWRATAATVAARHTRFRPGASVRVSAGSAASGRMNRPHGFEGQR
jgi:FlaA1/EpsC-like NDP-sugar epimerase